MTTATDAASARQSKAACFACGQTGVVRYRGLRDLLFGAPGQWDLATCAGCGVLWVDPMPAPDQIAGFYARYYTHSVDPPSARMQGMRQSLRAAWVRRGETGAAGSAATRIALAVPFIREELEFEYMALRFRPPGRVLDVGCGSGGFLRRMQRIGWQVEGLELDGDAANVAREALAGPVHVVPLDRAGLDTARFDAVTMSHVIEHVPDPIGYLREALRVCRPGGRLVLATPNARSLGHRLFGAAWRGLEVPRHLHLFTAPIMASLAARAGFRVVSVGTSARAARAFFVASRMMTRGRGNAHERTLAAPLSERLAAAAFQAGEDALRAAMPEAGEEVLLVAEKPADDTAG